MATKTGYVLYRKDTGQFLRDRFPGRWIFDADMMRADIFKKDVATHYASRIIDDQAVRPENLQVLPITVSYTLTGPTTNE